MYAFKHVEPETMSEKTNYHQQNNLLKTTRKIQQQDQYQKNDLVLVTLIKKTKS